MSLPTSPLAIVLYIVAALVGVAVYFFKRKTEPTPEQRIDDRKSEIDALFREIERLDADRDHAAADALRGRVRELLLAEAKRDADESGQRLPPDAASGNDDHTAG